jgi:hypothetical protein
MSRHELAQIEATCPGWGVWRTADGQFAARKGGSTPARAQAYGRTLAELKRAIVLAVHPVDSDAICRLGLRPHEQAVLDTLQAATGPLSARTFADVSGVPTATTGNALAVLRAKGLVTRHRKGRVWFYAVGARPGGDEPPD